MKNNKKVLLVAMLIVLVLSSAWAQIKLPAIVSSNMVLQRNAEINLWGWSKPGEQLSIEASWADEKQSIKADKEGKWQLKLKTSDIRGAQQIIISSRSEKVVLDNVLLGEVWLCSGQSNMEQPVKGFLGQPTYGSTESLLNSNNSNIRLFTIRNHGSKQPLDNPKYYSPWVEASPETVANFGAVAYFFGKGLHEFLDIPVGLIYTSRGASNVQAWMSTEAMSKFEEVDLTNVQFDQKTNQRIPTVLFNAMLYPLIPFTIKGTIWYQGESNRMDPEGYKKLLPAMVQDWRDKWKQGAFPFYLVQISPFAYGGNESFQDFKNSAFQREAQLECVDLIPNSGIAITMDIGDEKFIHPPRKKEVGKRLLLLALNKTYGVKGLESESPAYRSMEVQDGKILLKFVHAESGLYSFGELEDFEIAGEDHVFYSAKASIVNRKNILVESSRVTNPVAVRYGWKNWVKGTLFSGRLLPASSFRTDHWDDATRAN